MILKASQRGGDAALAAHLLNTQDNEHVEVHAISGFLSSDVAGAFQEMRAAARATKCEQYMFSLSLSPPEEAKVSNADFEAAIKQAMKRIGLANQPHVVIFHEKNARRHAHLVVSRIDANSMKAINLSFFKDRLCDLSRELFLHHGWDLPQGHIDRKLSDPLNYSLEEYQVAKRAKRDPKEIKAILKECWAQSDSKSSFEAALNEAGFQLRRGDRRGFVAMDDQGKIYSLSRWLDVKPKVLEARLGDPNHLPSIGETVANIAEAQANCENCSVFPLDFAKAAKPTDPLVVHLDEQIAALEANKQKLIQSHRDARANLREQQHKKRKEEIQGFRQRSSPLRRLWQWAVGNPQQLLLERQASLQVQQKQFDADLLSQSESQRLELRNLRTRIGELKRQRNAVEPLPEHEISKPQITVKTDPDFAFHKAQIEKSPDYVLRVISDKKAVFSENDIVRVLSDYFADPQALRAAIDQVMAADGLVLLEANENSEPRYSTRDYQSTHTRMMQSASTLASNKAYGVYRKHLARAINTQNKNLQKSAGAKLSDEQCAAIEHVLNRRQLACVVGLAGAGKSTLLSAAKDAWERQGYRVVGAALAGKAADGLQSSSGIASRTLHALEHGWKHGKNQLQAGDVLVVDEAGMVGTAQMERIIAHVKEQSAKLVLVGDPQQLQPIQAGTPFKDIADAIGYAELSKIRRQKADWQKAASRALARGETKSALEAYSDHGMFEHSQSEHDAITALVEDYMVDWELHGKSNTRVALAHRRDDVASINHGIRCARKSAGELCNEQLFKTDFGERAFAAGDRLLFTRNDYDLNVKNGMIGWVTSFNADQISVALDGEESAPERVVTFNVKRFSSFDHGYATTIHKAQGATVDHAFVLKTRTMDGHLDYVAMTRHKRGLKIYQGYNYLTSVKKETLKAKISLDHSLEN